MDILTDFSKTKVLVVGDVMLDRYWWGSVDRISPEAPVPIVRLEKMSLVAGGAANVAANLAGLGVTPYLVGVMGTDDESALLNTALNEVRIGEHSVLPVADRRTTIKTRIVAHSQHVVRIDHETTEPVSTDTAKQLLERVDELLPNVDAVLLSDYAKGVLSDEVLSGLLTAARERGLPVIVDPKGRDFSKYKGATLVTPNKREAAEAAGLNIDAAGVVDESGRNLLSQLDLEALLITEGEHGMTLFEAGGTVTHLDSLAHEVFDVTGAGDTVIATLTAAIASGTGLIKAAKLANAAAGIVVGNIGTTRITRDLLSEFLSAHENVQYIHA